MRKGPPPLEWECEVNGKKYKFSYKKSIWEQVLVVNGVPQTLKSSLSSVIGFDEAFDLDGREARLIIEKDKPDIAIDGKFVQSGEPYKPKPKWAVVFAVLCLGVLATMPPGMWVLPGLLGAGGAVAIIGVVKSDLSGAGKFALCLLITAGVWGLRFFLSGVGIFF